MFQLSKPPAAIIAASDKASQLSVKVIDGDIPELLITDYIGEDRMGNGIAADAVRLYLSRHRGNEVITRWNSKGGEAYAGIDMFNAIAEHGNVTAIIEGIVFSAAAIAASGARRIVMQEASSFGIHRALTSAVGNSQTLRAVIEFLENVDAQQVAIFAAKTGRTEDEIIAWMIGTDDGTIFSSSEALDAGFADEVIPIKKREESASTTTATAHRRFAAEIKQRIIKSRF